MAEQNEYVVDVLIPVSIAVQASDADMAAATALDRAIEQDLWQRIDRAIDRTGFVTSDSEWQTEVGVA